MILITCATGNLGNQTIDFLLKKMPATSITALVRNIANGEELKGRNVALRISDYSDYASLVQAFKGIDTLLFISSGTLENRVAQHKNVVDAAKENQVKHIVYTSAIQASDKMKFTAGIDHYHTEKYLKASGISYTILRNTFYTEVFPMLLGDALTTGEWYYAAGDAKVNFASRTDIAEALANVLAQPPEHTNKTYEITSGKSYSFSELAGILSTVVGKPVRYTMISAEEFNKGLKKAGVPEPYIPMTLSIAEAIAANEIDLVDPALENLLQRKPQDLKDVLPTVLQLQHA
jgi:NAD(P)H dehydrogenase (quinone)